MHGVSGYVLGGERANVSVRHFALFYFTFQVGVSPSLYGTSCVDHAGFELEYIHLLLPSEGWN